MENLPVNQTPDLNAEKLFCYVPFGECKIWGEEITAKIVIN